MKSYQDFRSLCFIFHYFYFSIFPILDGKQGYIQVFLWKKKLYIFKTSYPALSVYILNNMLVLLSTLPGLFLPIHHNYVPTSIICTFKSMHYVDTSNIYFAGLFFLGFFFLFLFCETQIKNEQFSVQSNFAGNEKWWNVMKRKKSWNKAELFHNTHKITPSL